MRPRNPVWATPKSASSSSLFTKRTACRKSAFSRWRNLQRVIRTRAWATARPGGGCRCGYRRVGAIGRPTAAQATSSTTPTARKAIHSQVGCCRKTSGKNGLSAGKCSAGTRTPEEGQSTSIMNFGGYYKFTPDFNLLFSAGHSIGGDRRTSPILAFGGLLAGRAKTNKRAAWRPRPRSGQHRSVRKPRCRRSRCRYGEYTIFRSCSIGGSHAGNSAGRLLLLDR